MKIVPITKMRRAIEARGQVDDTFVKLINRKPLRRFRGGKELLKMEVQNEQFKGMPALRNNT